MKLFTPGPVTMEPGILEEGSNQHPYFRTSEFSEIMLDIQKRILRFIGCSKGKIVPLGASGTGALDCTISNLVTDNDFVLVINNGTFGQRLVDLCNFYKLKYLEYKVPFGSEPDLKVVEDYLKSNKISVIMTQATETSSSQKIPVTEIGKLSRKYGTFFIVDAITAFLIDEYSMDRSNIDVSILSSQKGFCVPPGVSFIVMNDKAIERSKGIDSKSYYLNINSHLVNMERGQTPFSPPITILHQINKKLEAIDNISLDSYLSKIDSIAKDLRNKMEPLPFKIVADNPSNSLTAFRYNGSNSKFNAYELFRYLVKSFNYYITPVGGEFEKSDIRVAHIGDLTIEDNKKLIEAILSYPEL